MSSSYTVRLLSFATGCAVACAFWRLPCTSRLGVYRIDPIVSPNTPSEHAHILHGAQGISLATSYDEIVASNCTSCAVVQDKSVYWTPVLMFHHTNGTVEVVPQVNGMLIYYFLFGQEIQAFPKGFGMIAGNASRRSSTLPAQIPPTSFWGPQDKTQEALAQKALGFNCLHYDRAAEGALERHDFPRKAFIDSECTDGLRTELMFPSCWDGIAFDPKDQSHLKYPDLVMEGSCPEGYMIRIPALYYETIWDTAVFKSYAGDFLFSNGDPTGYSYHGDFLNGWDIDLLQQAIKDCTNQSGLINDCSIFTLQNESQAAKCKASTPLQLLNESCDEPRVGLCGNVPIDST